MTCPIVVAPRRNRKGCKTYRITCPICRQPREIVCNFSYARNPGFCMRCAQQERRLRETLASLPSVDSRPLWVRALEARQ